MKKNYDKRTRERAFEINDSVYTRNLRAGPKWYPGKIVKKVGGSLFIVETDRGLWSRHADQIKPRIPELTAEYSNNTPKPSVEKKTPELEVVNDQIVRTLADNGQKLVTKGDEKSVENSSTVQVPIAQPGFLMGTLSSEPEGVPQRRVTFGTQSPPKRRVVKRVQTPGRKPRQKTVTTIIPRRSERLQELASKATTTVNQRGTQGKTQNK